MIAALRIVSCWLLGDNSIRGDAYRSFWESFEPRVRLGGSVITYPHFGAPLSPACRITFPRMHDPSSADSSVACAACAHQHPKTRRSVSLLTRPMERRPLSAFPRGGGRAHLSGTN